MQLSFVLLNQTTHANLTMPVLQQMAAGLDAYVDEDVAPIWGGGYVVRADTTFGANECPVYIVDSLPNVPGAAAYHDRTDQGMPIIYVAFDEFSTFVDGDNAMTEGIGHELAETIGDVGANRWADRTDGTEEALELCDRLQGARYQKSGVMVPDFLLPAAFAPGSPPPYDFTAVLKGQTDQTPGGYVILRKQGYSVEPTADGHLLKVTRSVYAEGFENVTGKTRERKLHHSSRTFRRGV